MRFTVFSNFSKLLFVLHILAYSKFELRWFSPCQLWWTLFNSSFPTLRTVCIRDLHCFRTSQNCNLFCTFWLLRNLNSADSHHAYYSERCSNHHFPTLRTVCIWDLQCFQSFRNCCFFSTFWLIRNFYSGEAHHANYSKHSLNHHIQHCARCVYETYSVFKVIQIAISFAHFSFHEISTPVMHHMLTMANIV